MKRTCDRPGRAKRTNRSVARWALALGLAGIAAPPVRGDDPKPESFPSAPAMTVAPVDGVDDVAAYTRAVADHVTRLVELAEKSNDPLLRAELQLTGANLILARQIEPTCTRVFWRLADSTEHPTDSQMLTKAFETVDSLLTDAVVSLNEARMDGADKLLIDAEANHTKAGRPTSPDEEESGETGAARENSARWKPARITATAGHRRTLASFQQALRAALVPPQGDDGKRTVRRAASELAALVEHDDRRVATAAGFWQAYLRKGETDPHASLARLDYALDEFAPAEQPYAFFARVMRCDVLVGHGQGVAALALLTQMEERALGWYPDEEPRTQALDAIAWTKLRTLRAWHDALDPKERPDERAWCRAQATALITGTLTEPNRLPRLSPAIPMLFDADAVEGAAAANNEDTP